MATLSLMGDDLTIEHALAAFGKSGASCEPIVVGHMHRTYAVDADGGAYVLQRVNPRFPIGIHQNIRAVTEHLVSKGVATTQLVPTREGALVAELGEAGTWRLLTRMPGISYEVCTSPARAQAAGGLVARFHSALADLDHVFQPLGILWHDTPEHLRELERAVAQHPDHPLHDEIRRLATRILEFASEWRPLSEMPQRIVHTDLKFNNLLFDPASTPSHPEALSLIDLDTVCRLPLYVELGDAWRSWCNRASEDATEADFDLEIFSAAVEGYRVELEIDLDEAERGSLAEAVERISLELAARFAADALNESYFGWDPDRFDSRAEHNRARARGQYSLAEQARATRSEQAAALGVEARD